MSSNDSRATVTFRPVALVKASSSAMNALSSDWTKYFQRRSESCAPFSGFHGAACAQALAHSSSPEPASAPVAARVLCTRVRRGKIVLILFSPFAKATRTPRGLATVRQPPDSVSTGLFPPAANLALPHDPPNNPPP